MKKILVLLIAALLVLPGVVLAQGDSLSRADINRISNSVVMVLSFDSAGQPYATGSGTIVASSGVIYTNRHVLEGGMDFGILTVAEVGEPAVLTYYASPTLIHEDVDFAVLQIDRDKDGNRIDTANLGLPFINLANTLPDIGDNIFVFGYPTLGDVHLVMTRGAISAIENDTLNGERIPYWYQTDAQISPGNSGGLVVNAQGRMVGIPTKVDAEGRTLGRLGGILSIAVIRSALANPANSLPLPLRAPVPVKFSGDSTQPTPIPSNNQTDQNQTNQNGQQELIINITSVEHNVTNNGDLGMKVHTSAEAIGYKNADLRAAIFFFWQDGSPIAANNRASSEARTADGQMTVQQVITPGYDDTVWDDMWFFVPYSNFPDGRLGTYSAYVEAQLGVDGQSFTAFSNQDTFDYTYPDQQLMVDITSIDYNASMNGESGMQVHTHINAIGYKGQKLRVALFVYWADGTPIDGTNAPTDNRTTSGYLTVQDTFTPSYDNSNWGDYWFFLPYSYFPSGLHGAQDALAEVEIGLETGSFTSWSQQESFTLNYN